MSDSFLFFLHYDFVMEGPTTIYKQGTGTFIWRGAF